MRRIRRDYQNIKAQIWRNKDGFLCCKLLTVHDEFILTMVAAEKEESEADLIQTALRCLSANDLALANNGEAA